MAKQLNVSLKVQADTVQAKQQFNDLNSVLNQITTTTSRIPVNVDLAQAKQAASELRTILGKSLDINTNKLDISKFSSQLQQTGRTLTSFKQDLLLAGDIGQQAFLKLSQSIAAAQVPTMQLSSRMTQLGNVLKNTIRWQLSSSLLHGFIGGIQNAYHYAQDLNESLNNIRIVTGYSTQEMDKFAQAANRSAQALSTSTKDYVNASLIYYQQGLSDEEVKARTDATIKLANVSRQSAQEVSDQMTAVWNNFAKGSDNLEYYIDVMAKLGATTASSTKEIATGLEKFAAVANTVGLSYEYATAALATVTATTRQSAEIVGTAFKTLFARLQDLELGETLEDGTTLGKYSAALEVVGVNIKDINGEVKSMDKILDELGTKWKTISKDQQIALAQTVAGTRQYTQLIALMDNWDFMQKNLNTARGAEGTLNAQAKIYAESWEAARDRVKASAEAIYDALLDDKFFITLLNGFAKLLQGIKGFTSGLGGLSGTLSAVASIFMSYYAKEMPAVLQRLGDNYRVFSGKARESLVGVQNENIRLLEQEKTSAEYDPYQVQVTGLQKIQEMKRNLILVETQLSKQEQETERARISENEMVWKHIQALAEERAAIEKVNQEKQKQLQEIDKDNIANDVKNIDKLQRKVASAEKNVDEKEAAYVVSERGTKESDIAEGELDSAYATLARYRKELNQAKDEIRALGDEFISTINSMNGQEIRPFLNQVIDQEKLQEFDQTISTIQQQKANLENSLNQETEGSEKYNEILTKIQQFNEKLAEAEQNKQKFMSTSLAKVFEDIAQGGEKGAKASEKLKNITRELVNEYLSAGKSLASYKTNQKTLTAEIQKNNNVLKSSKKTTAETVSQINQMANGLKNSAKAAGVSESQFDAAFKKLSTSLKQEGVTAEQAQEAFKTFTNELEVASQGSITDLNTKLQGLGTSLQNLGQASPQQLMEVLNGLDNEADKMNVLKIAMDQAKGASQQFAEHQVTMSEAMTQASSGLMSLNTIMQSMTRLGDVFSDDDASAVEKIGAVIGALTGVIMAYNTVSKAGIAFSKMFTASKKKEAAAHTANAGAQGIETAATGAQTPVVAANAAAWNAHPVILIITLALMAVAAAIGIVSSIMKSNTEETKKNAEAAQKNADAANEEAQAHKDLVNEYIKAVNVFDGSYEAKQNLTKAALDVAKAYGIEDAAIKALKGDYVGLTKEIIKARQAEIQKTKNKNNQAITSTNKVLTDALREGVGHKTGSGGYAGSFGNGAAYSQFGIGQDEYVAGKALTDGNYKYLSKGSAGDVSFEVSDLADPHEMMAYYAELQQYANDMADIAQETGANLGESEIYEAVMEELEQGSEAYEQMVEYYKENLNLVTEELALSNDWTEKTGKNIYDIDNMEDYIAYRETYLQSLKDEAKLLNLNDKEIEQLISDGESYLNTFENLSKFSVDADAIDTFANGKKNINKDEFKDYYLSLDQAEKQVFWQYIDVDEDQSLTNIKDKMSSIQGILDREHFEVQLDINDQLVTEFDNAVKSGDWAAFTDLFNSQSDKFGGMTAEDLLSKFDYDPERIKDFLVNNQYEGFWGHEESLSGKIAETEGLIAENASTAAAIVKEAEDNLAQTRIDFHKAMGEERTAIKESGSYSFRRMNNDELEDYMVEHYDLGGAVSKKGVQSNIWGNVYQEGDITGQSSKLVFATLRSGESSTEAPSFNEETGLYTNWQNYNANYQNNKNVDAEIFNLAGNGNGAGLSQYAYQLAWYGDTDQAWEQLADYVESKYSDVLTFYGLTKENISGMLHSDINNLERVTNVIADIALREGVNTELGFEEEYVQRMREMTKQQAEFDPMKEPLAQATALTETNEGLQAGLLESKQKEVQINAAQQKAFDQKASDLGVNKEEVDALVDSLPSLVDNLDILDDSLKTNVRSQRQVALAIKQTQKGLKTLTDNFDSWKEALEGNDELEKAEALTKMKNALAEVMDFSDELNKAGMTLGSHFGQYLIENMDLVEKAADGDKDAIYELQKIATEDILIQMGFDENKITESGYQAYDLVFSIMADIQEMLDNNELKIGEVNDEALLMSLTNMINELGVSAEQAQAILATMGFDAQISEEKVAQSGSYWVPATYHSETEAVGGEENPNATYTKMILDEPGHWESTEDTETTATALKIETANYVGGGNISTKKGGTGRRSNSKKDKGGGGGKSPTKKAAEKKTDEAERYHVVRAQLEDLSREYDKASKAKDRLFGAGHLKMINKEIDAVDKLAKKQKQYLDEIKDYREKDFAAMTTTGKKGGIQYTVEDANGNQKLKTANVLGLKDWLGMDVITDPNGVITNYEEIMAAAKKWYNGKIDQYNAMSASQQEAADKNGWKELVDGQYEGFMDLLKQYEETNDLWEQEFENLLEKYRQKQDLELEQFQYKVEIKVKLNDAEIKRLEYIRKSLADDRWKSVEYLTTLWNNQGKNSTYQQLLEQGNIHTAAAGELLGASHGDVKLDANGNVISQPQYSDAGWIEALDQEEDAIYSNIDALMDLDDQMIHYYEETLSNANEKLNQYMTKLEDCTAVLEHYKTLMGLINKQDSEYYSRMDKLLKAQQQTATNEYKRAEQEYELAQNRYREMLAEYENTDWTGNEAGKQKMEDQLQAAYEHMTEWQDKALSKAEALAEAIKAVYENAVEGAGHAMEIALTGGMGFDELSNSMDRVAQTSDLLLTKTNQIYETNKLMNLLAKDIDKTDNIAAKTKLKNFKDEIQDMQNMNEMSKFDLEVAKARYEVLKAQIALEEAQNAKSTVRLQRDNEGNYGYVYTADQDKVDSAKQALEDKQNDLYNLTLEKANESAQALAQLDRDFVEEMNRINTEYANDEEKRQELLYQLREDYAKRREILERDSNTAYYWLNQVAATDSSEAWASAYESILPKTEEWKEQAEQYIETVQAAHDNYKKDIEENVAPTVEDLDQKIKDITEDSEKYAQWFEDFADKNDENLKAISDITNEYIKQRQEIIKLIEELNKYIAQIDAARRALAEKDAEEQAAKDRSSSSQNGNGGTSPTSSGNGGSGSGNSGDSSDSSSSGDNKYSTYLFLRSSNNKESVVSNTSYTNAKTAYDGVKRSYQDGTNKYSKVELWYNGKLYSGHSYSFPTKTGGGGGCFEGDTKIILEDYSEKMIKDIQIGDKVLAYNEEKHYFETQPVLDIFIKKNNNHTINVNLSNGITLKMTAGHPILTSSGWKSRDLEESLLEHGMEVKYLNIGDIVLGFGTFGRIESITDNYYENNNIVYTLKIDVCHTFIANNMIVHNAKVAAMAFYDSGGYTGDWIGGSEHFGGKLAMLHEKELVLNQDDTKNMLKTVSLVRELSSILDLQAAVAGLSTGISPSSILDSSQTLEQMVTIHAEFPNATNHNEIEEAFNSLVNRAAQYAGRSRQ